jgi:energy-coupling factor transporter ATP-binding protein EcfA2
MPDITSALSDELANSSVQEGLAISEPLTIWQELDNWAQNFRPWQKYILFHAVRTGRLTEIQIEEAYQLFSWDHRLVDPAPTGIEIPDSITGRPAVTSTQPVRLVSLRNMRSVNALPLTFELTFSNGLTVVYGRNGAGKTGAVRVLSNICFSRMQHTVLPNIYDDNVANAPRASAEIVMNSGSGDQSITFILGDNSADTELKRIALFDTSVARSHLVEGPLDFNPAGFDVFPEMARVYGLLANRLNAEIEQKKRENHFIRSFIGTENPVSRLVATLNANTDLSALRALAVFGDTEQARLQEVERQIQELQSHSVEAAIGQLEEAKQEILLLRTRLNESIVLLTEEQRVTYRTHLSDFTLKAKAVSEHGAESFKFDIFKNIGSSEWEAFLATAQALASTESDNYPQENDHCLLCHRPLDETSINLIKRFWGFLVSDARRQLQEVSSSIDVIMNTIEAITLGFFAEGTSVKAHVERLNPVLARQTTDFFQTLQIDCNTIKQVLSNGTGEIPSATFADLNPPYTALIDQIDRDIEHLRGQSVQDALRILEAERNTLQHKQILNQLLSDIEVYIADLTWVQTASNLPRRNLNPRPLTDKESELFSTLIAERYRERLTQECGFLDCSLPIEFRTRGDRGQTKKSLSMRGGYSPDKILSEGEQRAIALADFLTEVSLNPANAGIIVDDPVTSQDHDRKQKIAERLVSEAQERQVVIFTHDLVFFTMLSEAAKKVEVGMLTHWVHKDNAGRPGLVALNDSPSEARQYRDTQKAVNTLVKVRATTGSEQERLIRIGMGELRRTIEEIVPHFLFKEVVRRWTDRILVTSLKKINWDNALAKEIEDTYEELSAIIEGHTHTEERAGAPPEPRHLDAMITRVNEIIRRARPDRR